MLSAKGAERWAYAAITLLIAVVTIGFGSRVINHSLEARMVREVLFEWQRLGQRFGAGGGAWPTFEGHNHVAYMRALKQRMRQQGLLSPGKAHRLAFRPRLKRIGKPDEQLFILLLPGRMVIFGLSPTTFARIDAQVDGASDPGRGHFTGSSASNGNQMIGNWRL